MNFLKNQNYNSPQIQKAIESELKNVPDTISIPYQEVLNTLHINISLVKLSNNSDEEQKIDESKIIPPTMEMVKQYCLSRNNKIDPERFINFYQSKGWMVGKNKMKDWQSAIITWEKGSNDKQNKETPVKKPSDNYKNVPII